MMAFLVALFNSIIESRLTRYLTRPANATGTTVTGAAGANTKGAYAEIVAAAGITEDFWLAGIQATLNAVDEYNIDIATGAAAAEVDLVANFPIQMDTRVTTAVGETDRIHGPHWLPYPVLIPANTRVAVRLATVGGGSDTADVHLIFVTDLGGSR